LIECIHKVSLNWLDHPVVIVNWFDAVTYAKWLAKRTERTCRLLAEAEREKAARWNSSIGTARIYPWGDSLDGAR
jgi:formylglycine-generating enzyme required for sulfatase activity